MQVEIENWSIGIFALIFVVIWIVQFIIGKHNVSRMNRGLFKIKRLNKNGVPWAASKPGGTPFYNILFYKRVVYSPERRFKFLFKHAYDDIQLA